MTKKPWMNCIDSNVSATYVTPMYPKKGQQITVSLQIPNDPDILDVHLVSFQLGREMHIGMYSETIGTRTYRTGSIKVVDTCVSWYFIIVAADRSYTYSKAGLKASMPPLTECFSLLSDKEEVEWVENSVCYQIFPDRFRNGDESVGAREGAYEFDGNSVTIHDFDEKPLSFEEGKCLDFFNGDLKGIEDSIPYFKRLGITVLYLNPIGQSRTTHRYDCTDFFHVDEKLGGDEAFAHLCIALHDAGIKIIIDISINHTGTDHPWYKAAVADKNSEEAKYYYINEDGSVACWDDVPTLPQLNYSNQKLRDIMYRNDDSAMQRFLKKPFLQDGWRLDVASEVGRRGKDQFCEEIWREVRASVKKVNREAYIVGEDWVDSSPFLQGDMWDGTMNYLGSSRPLRSWLGETDRFLSEGWGHTPKKTRPFTGDELAEALQSTLDAMLPQMVNMQMNLLDSHDTPRLHANTDIFDFNLYAGIVKLLYVLPGMPNVFYGDEIALPGPYGSVEDSRYPMQWDQSKWNMQFFELYTQLGLFRANNAEILATGSYKILMHDDTSLCFIRYNKTRVVFCLLSKDVKEKTVVLDNTMLQIQSATDPRVIVTTEQIVVTLKAKESLLFVGVR